ncbi:MAG TPA: 50S ribosomal protein L11 methyltransferase [Gemmatimonadaceae bacterium]
MTEASEWVTVRVFPGSHRDAVPQALFAAGAQGVQELADSFVTHVHGPSVANDVVCAMIALGADVRVETEPTPDIDWSEQWKQSIGVQRLGALTVAPPWLAADLDRQSSIIIDPGMAFGTGEHATTRGVIRLLQRVVRRGDVVADLGAGSAVLAIAAAKLGATRVVAIEVDPDAIGNAIENVARNGVDDHVTIIEGDAASLLPLVAPLNVITANIISSVLLELLPAMHTALVPGGHAILSGILSAERVAMLSAMANDWHLVEEDSEDTWWSATIAPR